MNRKLKLALAALLGFSAACSTVKNAPSKGSGDADVTVDSVKVDQPMVVMYGVRPPKTTTGHRSLNSVLQQEQDSTATTATPEQKTEE